MPDYDALRATAARLIASFGGSRTATFYRREGGAYDPITDETAGAVERAYTIACTVVPRGPNDLSTPYGDRVENELVKILVPSSGLPITPRPGDEVTIPGRPGRFGVTDCKPLAPDGDPIMYTVLAEPGNTT